MTKFKSYNQLLVFEATNTTLAIHCYCVGEILFITNENNGSLMSSFFVNYKIM